MTSSTDETHHQAGSDRILGRCMVASVAIDTCHPRLTHWALPPGQDEVWTELFMAIDTDSIILLGGYTVEVQGEKD
jgi:hypothetical protein